MTRDAELPCMLGHPESPRYSHEASDNATGLGNQQETFGRSNAYQTERILRDYTGDTRPGSAEGDDIVQTATELGQGNLVR